MKRRENFHYRWVRADYVKGGTLPELKLSYPKYVLGQSNMTAKSKGGIGIVVCLAENGNVVLENDYVVANQLLWIVNPVSSQENYCKRKVRENAEFKLAIENRPTVMVSANYDYDIVKKIAIKLVNVAQEILSRPGFQKNKIWKTLKAEFDIDTYAATISQPVDVTIKAEPLQSKSLS